MKNRVVITGMGVVAPNGTGVQNFLDSLKNSISGIKYIPELADHNFGCCIGGVPDINNSPWINTIEQNGLNTASDIIRYAIIAALEAWTNAGLSIPDRFSDNVDFDTGSIIGSGIGSFDIFGKKIVPETNQGKIKQLRSTIVEHSMPSGASANLAGILGIGNIVSSNSSACSTGTESIILAAERIMQGKAKRIIAGASDAYSPYCWSGFDAMRVLTRKHNGEPQKGSRPLSATASGFVPGAGAGILILEELKTAQERGATIIGEIIGSHLNSGGQRQGGSMTAPNPEGVIKCICEAIREAKIKASDIDYISGHLSSTMADVIEIRNWTKALGQSGKDFPYINSLKSMIGHCIGAAGAIETIAALLQMQNSFVHASLNSEDLHPKISEIIEPEKVPQKLLINTSLQTIAKASFGFGDVNSCLIIRKIKNK